MKKRLLYLLIILSINLKIAAMEEQGNNFNNRYGINSHIMNTPDYFEQDKNKIRQQIKHRKVKYKKQANSQSHYKKKKHKKRKK